MYVLKMKDRVSIRNASSRLAAGMGARSAAEAHGFLTGRLRRSWGVAAVRAAAHLRISRLSFVGMPTRVVQGLRRAARAPYRGPVNPRVFAAGLRPDIGPRRFGRG